MPTQKELEREAAAQLPGAPKLSAVRWVDHRAAQLAALIENVPSDRAVGALGAVLLSLPEISQVQADVLIEIIRTKVERIAA